MEMETQLVYRKKETEMALINALNMEDSIPIGSKNKAFF